MVTWSVDWKVGEVAKSCDVPLILGSLSRVVRHGQQAVEPMAANWSWFLHEELLETLQPNNGVNESREDSRVDEEVD